MQDAPTLEDILRMKEDARKSQLRRKIEREAGDPLSIAGTASDAASLAVLASCALVVAAANSATFEEFKGAFLSEIESVSNDADMVSICSNFLDKVKQGEVVLPVTVKGIAEVVSDIEARNTAIARVLNSQNLNA